MRRLVLLAWLLCLRLGLSAQTGYEYRYWFDYEESKVQSVTSPSPTWKQNLDISSLSDGLHTLHIAVKDAKGVMSVPHTYLFFKQPISSSMSYSYWFDDDNSSLTSGIPVGKASMLDVSALQDGFHQIHIQAGSDDLPSAVSTGMFIKVPQTEGVDYMTCYCLMDGEEYYSERVSSSGGLVYWTFDVNSLPAGLHRIQCFVVTPSGAASSIADNFFFRVATAEDLSTMKCYYAIDGSDTYVQAGTCSNGLFHFDLDVSSIADGLHRVGYFLASESGTSTQTRMQFFMKTPVGGNGVVNYKYWINDDEAHAHSVALDKRENPFSLIKLLPVDTKPIRSSCFQFAIKNGSPILYAKNDFHIQFLDASNRLLDVTEQYVDEQVSQKLTGITALKETQTFARPAENGIKWFKFVAKEGDSIAFKTNIAASLQVFSPDGEEIYSASGSSSVTLGGCHTWDDGTYYLAVHDVTGSGSNLTLDYQKIDRYAVLDYTPKSFGIPSIVNISLRGNGFTPDTQISLIRDDVVIRSSTKNVENLCNLTATFGIDSLAVGKYDLKVVFTNEDSIVLSKAITMEPADSVNNISIELEGNPFFMAGSSATYEIRITNHGNVPVYCLPFTLTIDCEGNVDNIPYLKFKDDLKQPLRDELRYAFADQCSTEELNAFEYSLLGDDDLSFFYADTISEPGKAYLVGDFVLPRLDGDTTVVIPFTIKKANHNIVLYAFTKSHWSLGSFVNINHNNSGGNDSGGGSGSGSTGGSGSGGGTGDGGSGGGNSGGDTGDGGSGSGSGGTGGSGSGSSGTGTGSGTGGSGSSGSGSSGSGSSGTGSGGSGSGSSGTGSGGSGSGGTTSFCEDPCALKLAVDCFLSIIESINVAGSIQEIAGTCLGDLVQQSSANIFSDYFCKGELPDLSKLQHDPAPVLTDITLSVFECLGWETAKQLIGGRVVKMVKVATNCVFKPLAAWANSCPDDGDDVKSSPIHSWDPNEIYGYTSESGSKYMTDEVRRLNYRIQFENDTAFATASAHVVEVKDTLDSKYFDFSTYKPTSIKIGDKIEYLDGSPNFIKTIDMRPAIYAIAQVEGKWDSKKGIATWLFTSLDPMTMEPTDDVMQGFLPVNYDGASGVGEVGFEIDLKGKFAEGTNISNRASIVFDKNAPILTPTWTNIIDATPPTSHVTNVSLKDANTFLIEWEGEDALSGAWKYDVYYTLEGRSDWICLKEDCDTTAIEKEAVGGLTYKFCVVATDSAGNVEQKELTPEFVFTTSEMLGDVNQDGSIDISDVVVLVNFILGTEQKVFNRSAADMNKDNNVDISDVVAIVNFILGG